MSSPSPMKNTPAISAHFTSSNSKMLHDGGARLTVLSRQPRLTVCHYDLYCGHKIVASVLRHVSFRLRGDTSIANVSMAGRPGGAKPRRRQRHASMWRDDWSKSTSSPIEWRLSAANRYLISLNASPSLYWPIAACARRRRQYLVCR